MKRLLATLAMALVLPHTLAQTPPQPPEIAAKAYVLLDLSADQPLAGRNPDATVEPASLTKLMTAYLVFQALRDKKLSLDQELTVSERAWRTGMTDASRMYIQVGNKVKVEDLIKGMIVQSGNDATVLLAEAIGGSVENFVAMMNRQAQAFGLKVSHFKNPEGLPAPGHVSTVRELGTIATRLLNDFPGDVRYYALKEFTFNKITQQNRNLLLWRDPSVDGLKTGYTDAAGYCLIATAKRDFPNGPRRLITVVVGATSKEARAVESQKLLNWGYSAWDSVKVYDARQVITQAELWKGVTATAKLGTQTPVVVSVPRGEGAQLKTQLVRTDPLIAPLTKGQQVGTLKVLSGNQVVREVPVTVLEAVEQAGMFGRAWDTLRLWIR
ncbi:MAG: D-alanyl-D-alanine carboxypeptidase [Sphaerotilus sp.]|nr:D-alanyl-D-alanine carboxypeptidase [Sphaerotilus sp.]